jgi:hypothetical protein
MSVAAYLAKRRGLAGTSLRFVAAEKRLVRARADVTAAADVIRATVHHRVDNQVAGGVSGESAPPPLGPLPNRFTHRRVSRREQSLRPSQTASLRRQGSGSSDGPGGGDLFAA